MFWRRIGGSLPNHKCVICFWGGGGSDNLIASSHGLVTTYPVTCSYMYMDVYMILPLVCVQLRNHDIRDVLFTQSKNVFHF